MSAATMDPKADPKVSLQMKVPKRVRARLKSQAVLNDLEMSDLGAILLDHALTLMESGSQPADVKKAIDKLKRERAKKAKADEQES